MLRWALISPILVAVLAGALASSAAADRSHTVRSGQTLAHIARRYRVSVSEIRAANKMGRSSRLRPGQHLRIPDRFEAYVRPGDTLSHVARRHDVSISELRRINRLRSERVRPGQRLILPGFVPAAEQDRDWGEPATPGSVNLVRRGDARQIRLLDDQGRVLREGLRELAAKMRRHEDDAIQDANPRLALLLARISDHFGGRPITVVSGFREAGGYTRESSRHTKGRATDIRIRGVGNRTLWEFCRRLSFTGCGFYPRSTFVHVDVRKQRTQWVDWSRPGRRPRYGTLRGPARRSRRRHMARPRQDGEIPLAIQIVEPDGTVVEYNDTEEEEPDPEELEASEEEADSVPIPTTRERSHAFPR